LQGAEPSSALCMLICFSIEWACTYASASRRKLRWRQGTTCDSFIPSYLALIATGIFILNMDQTPVYFLMSSKKKLEVVGKKTIHIHMSTNDTKRTTVAVTIVGDNTLLPLTIIFKGKHDGALHKRSSQLTHQPTIILSGRCVDGQAGGCSRGLRRCLHLMLRRHPRISSRSAPKDIIPLLISDSYQCHMMASVVHKIQELVLEVKHIFWWMYFPLLAS
jgi:hypothetical protein